MNVFGDRLGKFRVATARCSMLDCSVDGHVRPVQDAYLLHRQNIDIIVHTVNPDLTLRCSRARCNDCGYTAPSYQMRRSSKFPLQHESTLKAMMETRH